jgi:hypothetical protein
MSDGTFFIDAIDTAHIDKMVLIKFWEVWMRGFITLRSEKPRKPRYFAEIVVLFAIFSISCYFGEILCPFCRQTRLVISDTVEAFFLIVTRFSTINAN